jgi:hypothetical protein
MSTDATGIASPVPEEATSWPALSLLERRVLGVLVEKAKTTPDVYPMSLNGLVTGCNQKSNRDPVLNLESADVEAALEGLKQKQFAQQITGGARVDKYRHILYEALKVDKIPLAILAELLLRGPQTEGELRGRASRMEPIADLDILRGQLRLLVQRGLVVYLTPENRRGMILTHGFHPPEELARLRSRAEQGNAPAGEVAAVTSTALGLADRVSALEVSLAGLHAEVQQLRAMLQSSEPSA